MKRFAVAITAFLFLAPLSVHAAAIRTQNFLDPIDAVSFQLPQGVESVDVRSLPNGAWQTVELDNVQDPLSRESQPVMFSAPTRQIEIRGATSAVAHPIRIAKTPVKSLLAAAVAQFTGPKIISRRDWGADPEFLYDNNTDVTETEFGDNGVTGTPAQRVDECAKAQQNYPAEFKVATTIGNEDGRALLWARQYSKEVKLLVIHHTALGITGDTRSGAERMRALYTYHAKSKGWGDIGYHYVVDETGQIFEGKSGGRGVVGGHAYCNNVGTLGIALMGNSEFERPTQAQMRALQWLITELAATYQLDLTRSVQFHGKTFVSPIVGHRDLVSTTCPGYYIYSTIGQVIANTKTGQWDTDIKFPGGTTAPPPPTSGSTPTTGSLRTLGSTTIGVNPGGSYRFTIIYTAPLAGAFTGKKIADVRLSSNDVQLFVHDGTHALPIRTGLLLQYDVPAGETATMALTVKAPLAAGNYTMEIGNLRFTVSVSGRRVRTGDYEGRYTVRPELVVAPKESVRVVLTPAQRAARRKVQASVSSSTPSAPRTPQTPSANSNDIRIRLSIDSAPTVMLPAGGVIGNQSMPTGTRAQLMARSGQCVAQMGNTSIADTVLGIRSASSDLLSVAGVKGQTRSYAGVLECRVVDNQLVLINQLPLDLYMEGLAEEPDTEPYEKQRAFAIAARTYALYYMQEANRKFPGKPYDGSDDPAIFQVYAGAQFADKNPSWVRAVHSTANQVLTYNGSLIKPPYFSSDDGRTRTPTEAKWYNFPFESIFSSKPDPWCAGMQLRGHGVGMSGCGALGQAKEGKTGEQILQYYYPGTTIETR